MNLPWLAQLQLISKIGPGNELLNDKVALLPWFRREGVLAQVYHVGMIYGLHCQNLTIETIPFVRWRHDLQTEIFAVTVPHVERSLLNARCKRLNELIFGKLLLCVFDGDPKHHWPFATRWPMIAASL